MSQETRRPPLRSMTRRSRSLITTSPTPRRVTGALTATYAGRQIGKPAGRTGSGSPRSSSTPAIVLSRSSRSTPQGAGSGVDVEHIDPAVFTLRSGKCIRVDYYGSKADALKGRGAGGVGAIAPDPIKPASANALQIDAFRS